MNFGPHDFYLFVSSAIFVTSSLSPLPYGYVVEVSSSKRKLGDRGKYRLLVDFLLTAPLLELKMQGERTNEK